MARKLDRKLDQPMKPSKDARINSCVANRIRDSAECCIERGVCDPVSDVIWDRLWHTVYIRVRDCVFERIQYELGRKIWR